MNTTRILIVEDSATQREVMAQLCRELGAGEVACAEHGRAALDAIGRSDAPFDLLICDLEMPDLNGVELIQLLASQNTQSAIVVVSGREQSLISSVELMGKAMGLRMLGAIQKPLTREQLAEVLATFKMQAARTHKPAPRALNQRLDEPTLRQALAAHEFVLHFQPQIEMKTGALAGVEALVRLEHDQQLIMPGGFISQCEEFGLIDDLSVEVVRLACEKMTQWQQHSLMPRVSINLSALSFDSENFSNQLMAIVQHSGIAPERFVFEVTETAVVKDTARALGMLARLRLLGCGLSIDDYGTGYSSVKQLSQLPFTELKMDRALVDGIAKKVHLQVIFDSTLSMCHKLGLTLVAEGVEQGDDWDYICQHGGDIGQGFYYAPPLPSRELCNWYQAGMPAMGRS